MYHARGDRFLGHEFHFTGNDNDVDIRDSAAELRLYAQLLVSRVTGEVLFDQIHMDD